MSFWNSLHISASGLSAQSLRLDVIANNIANAETTSTDEGGPYQRQDVVFTANSNSFVPSPVSSISSIFGGSDSATGGVASQIITDTSAGEQVYDPTNPDADENGYVTYPNVDLVVEMTNMLSATRSYEANLSVVEAAKSMAQNALDIAR